MSASDQHQVSPGCRAEAHDVADADQQREIHNILKNLKQDLTLMGCISLGKDGVLRSLTADRNVVDAVGLTPHQITAFLRRMPAGYSNMSDYEGADGTRIPKEKWSNPDSDLLPPPLDEDAKHTIELAIEENPAVFQKKKDELKLAWDK
ncbi:hypothetical protein BX600DRAFT_443776 [Xylariales sp. PMI_506]|nr:hypothetical protein BX600DRAFT_443776 [Xylariales sp. PMI_506]